MTKNSARDIVDFRNALKDAKNSIHAANIRERFDKRIKRAANKGKYEIGFWIPANRDAWEIACKWLMADGFNITLKNDYTGKIRW
jgi:hypothetical protein